MHKCRVLIGNLLGEWQQRQHETTNDLPKIVVMKESEWRDLFYRIFSIEWYLGWIMGGVLVRFGWHLPRVDHILSWISNANLASNMFVSLFQHRTIMEWSMPEFYLNSWVTSFNCDVRVVEELELTPPSHELRSRSVAAPKLVWQEGWSFQVVSRPWRVIASFSMHAILPLAAILQD